ncbi:myosin light chain kinase, smooth muscle isoform 1 [Corchorus capsularis]|uniref:Myosin light chain kinase, smooth muscle isoform 1 n=1 Tax=Corchorus capsularis TaxID=210143 RepID=A0A1R3G7C8_COCAP|nr:myosin light chain kinase, smooth muscle isoform 1 [Corchorus capsularis]
MDNSLLCDLFGHEEFKFGSESNIISAWEISAKGKANGNRRFLRIKKAARNKVRMEVRRTSEERTEVYTQGPKSAKWNIHVVDTIELTKALVSYDGSKVPVGMVVADPE